MFVFHSMQKWSSPQPQKRIFITILILMFIFCFSLGRPFHLPKGTTTYNFIYTLESKLPSSFSGDCGKIKYKMEFVIDKPWKFDGKQTIVLNVLHTMDLNKIENIMLKLEKQVTKTIGIIGSGPISLYISIPKRGFILGESIPVQVNYSQFFFIHLPIK